MNKRSVLKVLLFLVYVALVVLFFALAKERKSENSVCADSPCIRFCNEDRDSSFYNETSDGFEITNPISNVTQKYQIIYGKTCENLKSFESDQWKFSSTGEIYANDSFYSVNQYCLEINEEAENESESGRNWSLMICDDFSKLYETFYLTSALTTVVILVAIFLLYVFINELKSLQGKCVIGFVLSIIIACILARLEYEATRVVVNYALIFAFLWVNVMIFDVWWTLSYFHNSSGGKFKFYCFFVAGYGAAAIIIALLFFKFLAISYAFLAGAILLCLTCFIFAAIKIYEMTNVNMDFGNKRFAQEEQRFLTYLLLFTITLVTWSIEIYVREFIGSESFESLMVADVLGLLQAVMFFTILVLRRNVREVIIRSVCCC